MCVILELAHAFNEQDIFDRCFHFIMVNATDVLKAANFKDLCRECLKKVLTSNDLNANEFDVYDAIVHWADGECLRNKTRVNDARRREVLGDILFSVRFALMDVNEFTHRLSMKDVLTADEKVVLYQFFHGEVSQLPREFNRTPRKRYKDRDEIAHLANANDEEKLEKYQHREDENKRKIEFADELIAYLRNQPMLRVLRFSDIGGPWHFRKGADAIRFRCSRVIVLRGVEIFGPCSGIDTYKIDLTLSDDMKNEVGREYFTLVARDPQTKTYDLQLKHPVRIPADRMFTVSAQIRGSPSYQGIRGEAFVETEGVAFEFHNSNGSFNGTDVTVGQIPALLFSL